MSLQREGMDNGGACTCKHTVTHQRYRSQLHYGFTFSAATEINQETGKEMR